MIIETLEKLLGSSDTVNELKMGFIHTLYTPSKILYHNHIQSIGQISIAHGHVIKDWMQPEA